MAHPCNLSIEGDQGKRTASLRPNLARLCFKINIKDWGWGVNLRGTVPWFDPQYHKKKVKNWSGNGVCDFKPNLLCKLAYYENFYLV